ncbi:dTDP-Rha--alpha-D-GlcNAc-pyrophosphate polyprenol alpha-3-L-rhamnosyltransferase [Flavobacterium faecale]|uniref:dTDP-Rha--alpha-D-GlcNAc-pyrophosphate polyprenol alpha-3-L-rhamnosyltransferase n=1 Tax=Flavobacterium faecale TaxID=1355330 RepID=A0A2S1LFQ1_9FLAO|nr:glycosyltransferase family 2 protein [Flavobacterium faecale]AWG22481.1 dTDP-Rha--alpha-D-GlcNAc-pyrophosphate polyprenol alpha-3-L-rhamnosyltransferase [Flavobacterium faecale]
MKIAVVILNWNGVALLKQFLPSVIQYSPEATIYVADNASTDNSIPYIKEHFPTVQIVKNKENYGFAQGYNEALLHIDADVYALVNSDIEVTENWLVPIITTFEKEPNTAVLQPKILDFKIKANFEYAGAAGGFIDKYGFPYCRGRIFDTIEKDKGQYNDEKEIFWASGACFFIRSNVYKDLKGFDNDFFAHQEEIDLCWRILNQGYKIKYTPYSTVYHVGGATLDQGNPKKTYLNFRNSLFMLVKNLPTRSLFPIILSRMILDGIAGFKFISEGKWKHFWAILRAHFSFYGSFLSNYNKRTTKQQLHYYKEKSIVYKYYVQGGKIFVN